MLALCLYNMRTVVQYAKKKKYIQGSIYETIVLDLEKNRVHISMVPSHHEIKVFILDHVERLKSLPALGWIDIRS